MSDNNEQIFNNYIDEVKVIKNTESITSENIKPLIEAADALLSILADDDNNNVIKAEIATIKGIDENTGISVISGLKSDFQIDSLKFKQVVSNDESKSVTGVDVKQLDNAISNYDVLNGKIAYKATTPNGEYIVFKGTKEDFQLLKGGKKSRKSKTHRQKKVHRSTQKRNGRKRTSHRRK